jgi:hypothetical protein
MYVTIARLIPRWYNVESTEVGWSGQCREGGMIRPGQQDKKLCAYARRRHMHHCLIIYASGYWMSIVSSRHGHEIVVQENWRGLFGKIFPFHLYFLFLLCIDNKNGNLSFSNPGVHSSFICWIFKQRKFSFNFGAVRYVYDTVWVKLEDKKCTWKWKCEVWLYLSIVGLVFLFLYKSSLW